MEERSPAPGNILALAVIFEGGLGLLAVGVAWLFDVPLADQVAWTPRAFGLGAAASLPLVGMLVVLRRIRSGPVADLNRLVDEQVVPIFAGCRWPDFALISILAGLGEELLFRGVVQGGLAHWMPPVAGLLLASLLFGLAHSISPAYAVLAGLLGLYLGGLWLATGNLLVAIVAHALYDFVALVYLTRGAASVGSG